MNINDNEDPKNANIHLSIDQSAFGQVTCDTLDVNFDLSCGDITMNPIYGGAATQIQNSISASISGKQDTINSNSDLSLNTLSCVDLNISGTVIGLPIDQELRQIKGMGPNGLQLNLEFGGVSPTAMFSIPITAPSATFSGYVICQSDINCEGLVANSVNCFSDLNCGGDLSANSIQGAAAVQIQNSINASVSGKQDLLNNGNSLNSSAVRVL